MRRAAFFAVIVAAIATDVVFAQSGELELDSESGAERSAVEELLEQLRRHPLDLRSATDRDLMQIPGVRRQEARKILRAVRAGEVTEIRAVDFLPGVRQGTAERLAPYVILRDDDRSAVVDGRLRLFAAFLEESGLVQLSRDRFDLSLEGVPDPSYRQPWRMEIRRSGPIEPGWFTYARVPGPLRGSTLYLGSLDVRSGSTLLDNGRRVSILRPSDWERRLRPEGRVAAGYDAGTAGRGAALMYTTNDRALQLVVTADDEGQRAGSFSWREDWPTNVSTQVVREFRASATSVRLEYMAAPFTASIEGAFGGEAPSLVASIRWSGEDRATIHGVIRSLRAISSPGTPRMGGRTSDEVGVSLAWQQMIIERIRWHLVGDVGRNREKGTPPGRLRPTIVAGAGAVFSQTDRRNVGVEWTQSDHDGNIVKRWTLHISDHPSRSWTADLTYTRRSERSLGQGDKAGSYATATLSWASPSLRASVRWISAAGDADVEFWNLGPGPSSLGGLQRIAGRSGQLRSVFQWRPSRDLEIGILAAWSFRPDKELKASILFEFHL